MRLRWKEIGTAGRIEAIRSVWFSGCSTSQIAAHFEGATRNAIIGAYHRHGRHLLDKPLRSNIAVAAEKKSKKRRAEQGRAPVSFRPEPPPPKPLPTARDHAHEARLCGKPLVMLKAKECKWSVNEAGQGGLHLFCGLPSEGSYCAHHEMRSYRPAKAG